MKISNWFGKLDIEAKHFQKWLNYNILTFWILDFITLIRKSDIFIQWWSPKRKWDIFNRFQTIAIGQKSRKRKKSTKRSESWAFFPLCWHRAKRAAIFSLEIHYTTPQGSRTRVEALLCQGKFPLVCLAF